MKILILSCATGEGHNAAGRALKERLLYEKHEATMLDLFSLSHQHTSRIVGQAYVQTAKNAPHVFGACYRLADRISSPKRKSPVYYANILASRHLNEYLQKNAFDAVVMPHLFPAEVITHLKQKNAFSIPSVVITTDYTCIPFWEETNCDYYILPHPDLVPEYVAKGVPFSKLIPLGMPVSMAYSEKKQSRQAKKMLGFPQEEPLYLIMSGSMGFGNVRALSQTLYQKCNGKGQIVIICGNNKKLKQTLEEQYAGMPQMHIIGFTNAVASYMDACDVIFTKPGGLTSSEALTKQTPIVHTFPIPGCETANRDFFLAHHLSMAPSSIAEQAEAGILLASPSPERSAMLAAQKEQARPHASQDLVAFLEKITHK